MSRSTQATVQDTLNYLFERPTEPIFQKKGGDSSAEFVIPESYYNDRYRPISNKIVEARGPSAEIQVQVKELKDFPDLSLAESLPLRENFSVFNDYHRACATQLIKIFMEAKTFEDFASLCAYVHDRVNSYLYVYALTVAAQHRTDAQKLRLPSHLNTFPQLYMDRGVFADIREENDIVPMGSRMVTEVPMDYTASNLDFEHRVAYFREDVGVNLHHWHWHTVYPNAGDISIVQKDRRGELFYYMHQQIIARYNMERLCNNLARVRRLVEFNDPIVEGYFPKLTSVVASRIYQNRHSNSYLTNVNREDSQLKIDIQMLNRWRDRIYEAIDSGFYITASGTRVKFTIETGIDVLGNILEASPLLSPNFTFYGNLHNDLHNAIAYIHDPDNRNLESSSVMGELSTAMRDPVFYRVHALINDIFESYKNTLPEYTKNELAFDKIKITKVQVATSGAAKNEILTFWQQADVDLSLGLDFSNSSGPVYSRITHIQHAPFDYNITVQNDGQSRIGTVRIFYGPKFGERNRPLLFPQQRNLMVELDRFTYQFNSGANTIIRKSTASSVTIPYEQTFRNLSDRPVNAGNKQEVFNFCGCGWPQHMLVAKGTTLGFRCDLFVMVSDYKKDEVPGASTRSQDQCDDAVSYCGIRNSKYPDKQAMGYPFDRKREMLSIAQFIAPFPNMKTQEITVKFSEKIVAPRSSVQSTLPSRRP